MVRQTTLRPVERCVLHMSAAGMTDVEIGRRLRRGPEHVARIRSLTRVPRHDQFDGSVWGPHVDRLNPLERCVLRWREQGAASSEIAIRLRRTAGFVRRVEDLARYKLEH